MINKSQLNIPTLEDNELDRRSLLYWCDRLNSLYPAPDLPLNNNPNTLDTSHRLLRRTSGATLARLPRPRNAHQDTTEPAVTVGQVIQYSQKIDPKTWLQLKQRGKQAQLTPQIILLSIYTEILTTWSKNPCFTINVVDNVINGDRSSAWLQEEQNREEYMATSLLSIDYAQSQSFLLRGKQIQTQLEQNSEYQLVNLNSLLRELTTEQTDKLTPILACSFTSIPQSESTIEPSQRIWLQLQYAEKEGTVEINLNALENLFPPGMVADMLEAYCNLLKRLSERELAWKETTRQLIPPAQLQQRAEINNTTAPIPEETLYSLFIERAKQQPQKIALVTPQKSLTYQELSHSASQIGRRLQNLGIRPKTLVGIVMEKGWEQIVAVLGILAIGAAYVPIDPELPSERLSYLLENSATDIVLTQSWLVEKLPLLSTIQHLSIDREDLSSDSNSLLTSPAQPDDLAYVIYTSGSTGLPKGVMISHRNVVNVVIHTNKRFQVGSGDRILALTALNHDLSVYDIFGALIAGGTIVMPSAAAAKFPRHWLDSIGKEQVTLWNSVPAMMEMLVNYLEIKSETLPSSLRLAILGGDWLPISLVNRLKALAPELQILSIGGPTETTIWNIGYSIQQIDPTWKSIPYGQPMANSKYYILQSNLEDCPVWVAGQMYCAGVQLAQGYWRNPEKTAANFITHPRTGERIYRTGDLGRYLPGGNIEFLGRADFQIKLRGYRIEAGEIESILTQHPAIQNAVVTVGGKQQHQPYLVAYLVPADKQNLATKELQNFLSQKLPSYMVPSRFISLDTLPLTSNNKVDRRALSI
ncbi:Barbamide biosynthesis protein BarG (fragment) [Hyella patelloides LEGE 07179]|uniref:Barbamide biosynthesis protein BarG n=1 Tax=Hyella patelloides LEGE 07179 TaxID=945734 RepID=A0A563W1Y1_9CYAN